MSVFVDEKRCVGCGLCAATCPRGAIHTYGISMINENRCTDCFGGMGRLDGVPGKKQKTILSRDLYWRRACVAHCPVKAIKEG